MSTTLPQTSNCSKAVSHISSVPEKTFGQTTLALGNKLKVEQAAKLKTSIRDAFETTDHLVLDAAAVEAADLSFIQLICAAHRLAVGSGKRLSWAGPMPSAVIELIETAGVTCSKGCGGHKGCLWPERS